MSCKPEFNDIFTFDNQILSVLLEKRLKLVFHLLRAIAVHAFTFCIRYHYLLIDNQISHFLAAQKPQQLGQHCQSLEMLSDQYHVLCANRYQLCHNNLSALLPSVRLSTLLNLRRPILIFVSLRIQFTLPP